MHEGMTLISTLAAAFGLALILGLLAQWARLPALVGYLLAGVLIGPYTPGFVGGVMLLMFGVGLHFSVGDLMSVKGIALPGALVQMGAATAMGAGLAHFWWGWDIGASLVFGLALSVASTVVLLKALEKALGDKVATVGVEKVPEGPDAEAEARLRHTQRLDALGFAWKVRS